MVKKRGKRLYFKGLDGKFISRTDYYYLLRNKLVVKSRTSNFRGSIKALRQFLAKDIGKKQGKREVKGSIARKDLYKAASDTSKIKKLRPGQTRKQIYEKSKKRLKKQVLSRGTGKRWTYFRWGFYVSYRIDGHSPTLPFEGRNATVLPGNTSLYTVKDASDWTYQYDQLLSWCLRAKAQADANGRNIQFWVLHTSGYEYHQFEDIQGFNRIIPNTERIFNWSDIKRDIKRATGA